MTEVGPAGLVRPATRVVQLVVEPDWLPRVVRVDPGCLLDLVNLIPWGLCLAFLLFNLDLKRLVLGLAWLIRAGRVNISCRLILGRTATELGNCFIQ